MLKKIEKSTVEIKSQNDNVKPWFARFKRFENSPAGRELEKMTERMNEEKQALAKEAEMNRTTELINRKNIGEAANPDFDILSVNPDRHYIDELGFVREREAVLPEIKLADKAISGYESAHRAKIAREKKKISAGWWQAIKDGMSGALKAGGRRLTRMSGITGFASEYRQLERKYYIGETVRAGHLLKAVEYNLGNNPDEYDYGVALAAINDFIKSGRVHDNSPEQTGYHKLIAKQSELINRIENKRDNRVTGSNLPAIKSEPTKPWHRIAKEKLTEWGNTFNYWVLGITTPEFSYEMEKTKLRLSGQLAEIQVKTENKCKVIQFDKTNDQADKTAELIAKGVERIKYLVSNERQNRKLHAWGKLAFWTITAGVMVLLTHQSADGADNQDQPDHPEENGLKAGGWGASVPEKDNFYNFHSYSNLELNSIPVKEGMGNAASQENIDDAVNSSTTHIEMTTEYAPKNIGYGIVVDPETHRERPMEATDLEDSVDKYGNPLITSQEPENNPSEILYSDDKSATENLMTAINHQDKDSVEKFLDILEIDPETQTEGKQPLTDWLLNHRSEIEQNPKSLDWIVYVDAKHPESALQTLINPDESDYALKDYMQERLGLLPVSNDYTVNVENQSVEQESFITTDLPMTVTKQSFSLPNDMPGVEKEDFTTPSQPEIEKQSFALAEESNQVEEISVLKQNFTLPEDMPVVNTTTEPTVEKETFIPISTAPVIDDSLPDDMHSRPITVEKEIFILPEEEIDIEDEADDIQSM